jgi:hypothetical protein
MDSSRTSGKFGGGGGKESSEVKGREMGLRLLATCTWQGLKGRQHQMKGRRRGIKKKENKAGWLETIIICWL